MNITEKEIEIFKSYLIGNERELILKQCLLDIIINYNKEPLPERLLTENEVRLSIKLDTGVIKDFIITKENLKDIFNSYPERKTEAIKKTRNYLGIGLREAKDFIDNDLYMYKDVFK